MVVPLERCIAVVISISFSDIEGLFIARKLLSSITKLSCKSFQPITASPKEHGGCVYRYHMQASSKLAGPTPARSSLLKRGTAPTCVLCDDTPSTVDQTSSLAVPPLP